MRKRFNPKITFLTITLTFLILLTAGCSQETDKPVESLTSQATHVVARGDDSPVPERMPGDGGSASAEGTVMTAGGSTSGADREKPLPETQDSDILTMPEASGIAVYGNDYVEFDASNLNEGYIMARNISFTTKTLKVIVIGPNDVKYTYNLNTEGRYEVFPLSEGDGFYNVAIYQNLVQSKYTKVYEATFNVKLEDEFRPFLLPNQYVSYNADTLLVKKAGELTKGMTSTMEIIEVMYNYIVENYSYDTQLAANVTTGYLPDLDVFYEKGTGICFDYAAGLTAMLRSAGIPAKLIVGYTGDDYHAWISTYSKESGWLNAVIYFEGNSWKRLDPTFASGLNSSDDIMDYIENDNNYVEKYLY